MDKCEIAIDMLLWALKWDLGDVDTGVAAMQGSWGGVGHGPCTRGRMNIPQYRYARSSRLVSALVRGSIALLTSYLMLNT